MSVIVTADLHFSDNRRDRYRHLFMDHLLKMLREHRASHLLILGDLTEEKDRHNAELVNAVVAHMVRLSQVCPVILLRGNHDALDPEWPFFRFLGQLERVDWVNKPTVWALGNLGRCLFLPHTSDYKRDWNADLFEGVDFVFAHNTFKGAKMQNGQKADGVPTSVFPKGVKVISGDVHIPQAVGQVVYVGAPYLVDFGDEYNPRVLKITDNRKLYTLCCPGPQKRLIVIGDASELEAELEACAYKINNEDILKVRVNVTEDQYTNWADIKDIVSDFAEKHDCVLHMVQPVHSGTRPIARDTSQVQKSDEDVLLEYAKGCGVGDRTLKVGIDLL